MKRTYYLLLIIVAITINCRNRDLNKKDANELNCRFSYDDILKGNVFYDLESPAYFEKGGMAFLKVLNRIPEKMLQEQYDKIYMILVISKEGRIVKIDFEKPVTISLRERIVQLLMGTGGWIPGKCGQSEVVSKVNLAFTW